MSGQRNQPATLDMRSRNLSVKVIEGEKDRFCPAQLMHLVDKGALSNNLHDIRVLQL